MPYFSKIFIKNILLIIVFGFGAGVVGASALWSMLMAYRTELITGRADIPALLTTRSESIQEKKILDTIRQQTIPTIVDFWNAPSGTSARGTFYLPEDAVGHGIILTTDGWIVTHESVLPRDRSTFRVGVGPAIVKPVTYLLDTETHALFIKIQAENLNAARFAGSVIADATAFYKITNAHDIRRLEVHLARTTGIVSSDALTTRYMCDCANSPHENGTALVDAQGDIAGMVIASGVALPAHHITSVLHSLLAKHTLARPSLGVNGIQLAGARVEGSGRERGFLLRSDARTGARAVARKSPAEAAGLKEGDSILKINDIVINGEGALADLLLAFRPGDTVDLRIARGTEEVVIPVTLGERQSGKPL